LGQQCWSGKEQDISALIAANQMRKRDERLKDQDKQTATCPTGKVMTSPGTVFTTTNGLQYQNYTARAADCNACPLSGQCLKGPLKPKDGRGRQVSRFLPKSKDDSHPSELMRKAIDSPKGRQLYSQRIGTVEPVFANLRHNSD